MSQKILVLGQEIEVAADTIATQMGILRPEISAAFASGRYPQDLLSRLAELDHQAFAAVFGGRAPFQVRGRRVENGVVADALLAQLTNKHSDLYKRLIHTKLVSEFYRLRSYTSRLACYAVFPDEGHFTFRHSLFASPKRAVHCLLDFQPEHKRIGCRFYRARYNAETKVLEVGGPEQNFRYLDLYLCPAAGRTFQRSRCRLDRPWAYEVLMRMGWSMVYFAQCLAIREELAALQAAPQAAAPNELACAEAALEEATQRFEQLARMVAHPLMPQPRLGFPVDSPLVDAAEDRSCVVGDGLVYLKPSEVTTDELPAQVVQDFSPLVGRCSRLWLDGQPLQEGAAVERCQVHRLEQELLPQVFQTTENQLQYFREEVVFDMESVNPNFHVREKRRRGATAASGT